MQMWVLQWCTLILLSSHPEVYFKRYLYSQHFVFWPVTHAGCLVRQLAWPGQLTTALCLSYSRPYPTLWPHWWPDARSRTQVGGNFFPMHNLLTPGTRRWCCLDTRSPYNSTVAVCIIQILTCLMVGGIFFSMTFEANAHILTFSQIINWLHRLLCRYQLVILKWRIRGRLHISCCGGEFARACVSMFFREEWGAFCPNSVPCLLPLPHDTVQSATAGVVSIIQHNRRHAGQKPGWTGLNAICIFASHFADNYVAV